MKIILTTSSLTYVPNNYDEVLEFLTKEYRSHIAGVVIVKTDSIKNRLKPLYLWFAGCPKISGTMIKNILTLKNKRNLIETQDISYLVTKSINSEDSVSWLDEKQPDLILNLRTRCLFKESVLSIPAYGCVNLHHGLLPYQRGLFCDLHALYNAETTGITLHKMDKKIDSGGIISKKQGPDTNDYKEYLENLTKIEILLLKDFMDFFIFNQRLPKLQVNTQCNTKYTSTPTFSELIKIRSRIKL